MSDKRWKYRCPQCGVVGEIAGEPWTLCAHAGPLELLVVPKSRLSDERSDMPWPIGLFECPGCGWAATTGVPWDRCPHCDASREPRFVHVVPERRALDAEAEIERLRADARLETREALVARVMRREAEVEALRAERDGLLPLLRGAVGFIERNPGPHDVGDWLARAREALSAVHPETEAPDA